MGMRLGEEGNDGSGAWEQGQGRREILEMEPGNEVRREGQNWEWSMGMRLGGGGQ